MRSICLIIVVEVSLFFLFLSLDIEERFTFFVNVILTAWMLYQSNGILLILVEHRFVSIVLGTGCSSVSH